MSKWTHAKMAAELLRESHLDSKNDDTTQSVDTTGWVIDSQKTAEELIQQEIYDAFKRSNPIADTAMHLDIEGNVIDKNKVKARNEYLSMLTTLSIQDAERINPDVLMASTFAYCNTEAIIANVFTKLNRQPTENAVRRTVDFMLSTTQAIRSLNNRDADKQRKDNMSYQNKMDDMLTELNNLIFVSKARIIFDDFPESISLSVQLLPSIGEHETQDAMIHFESILQHYKPKELIELEVSITNKVVY